MAYDSEITQKSRDLIVLERARERVARDWCQNKFGSLEGGPVCAVGALICANVQTDGYDSDAVPRLENAVRPSKLPLMMWNDAPGRTQAEVLARFDEAIARLAGRS